MAQAALRNICKEYPGGVLAVDHFNLEIKDKEFVVLVGPSGCGKSTTLRMIAGLEDITEGQLYIGEKLVNNISPKDRDIAMVFQNYALYPHMTVYQNMAFGLKMRRMPKTEIKKRVEETAALLEIDDLLKRKPKALSGGQRQRVALGRAMVRSPAVFLLDEPLSNLDVALRLKMRRELQEIQRKTGITTLFITHDQQEALGISHRIAVMNKGDVMQIGTPDEIYNFPKNDFTAKFVGATNKITAGEAAQLGMAEEGEQYVRPERLCLTKAPSGIPVTVEEVQFEGPFYQYRAKGRENSYQVISVNQGTGCPFPVGARAFLKHLGGNSNETI